MDWKRVADKAKQVIDERGGPESLKEDADELRKIAEGPGTLADKAKQAAEAIKEPGAHHDPEVSRERSAGQEADVGREPSAGQDADVSRERSAGGQPGDPEDEEPTGGEDAPPQE